jgi:hypothetical protein
MPAVRLTRPQYVLRSYCDSGSSRLPGMEVDMLARGGRGCLGFGGNLPFLFFFLCPVLVQGRRERQRASGRVVDSISCVD